MPLTARVLLCVVLALSGCEPQSEPKPLSGDALEVGNRALSLLPVGPGERVLTNQSFLRNISSSPIRVESIEPAAAEGLGTIGRITGIELGLRGSPPIPAGYYKTYPPVMAVGNGRCGNERIVGVRGYMLEPGAEARLVVRLEVFDRPGTLRVRSWSIHYRKDGRDYRQQSTFGIALRVDEDRPPRRLFAGEEPCLDETTVLSSGPPPGR